MSYQIAITMRDKCASSPCCDCCQNMIIDEMKYSIYTKIVNGFVKNEFICSACIDIEHIIQSKKNMKQLERLTIQNRPTFSWKKLPEEIDHKILGFLDEDTKLILYCDKIFHSTPEEVMKLYKEKFIDVGKMYRPNWRASVMSCLRNSNIISKSWVDSVKSYESKITEIFSHPYDSKFKRFFLWKCKRWFRYYNKKRIMRKNKILYVYDSRYQFIKNI